MRKIIIATHGRLASGFKDALDLILGGSGAACLNCYRGELDDTGAIAAAIEGMLNDEDEFILLTDMLAGSVNKAATGLIRTHPNLHIVTGLSLPLLLELALSEGEIGPAVAQAMEAARQGVVYVNELLRGAGGDV